MSSEQKVKMRPILSSTEMVQAILDDRKTITRRIVNPMPGKQAKWLTTSLLNTATIEGLCRSHEADGHGDFGVQLGHPKGGPLGWIKCPYGAIGDILWVRESFNLYANVGDCGIGCEYGCTHGKYVYKATGYWDDEDKWKPSIHMPFDACRLFLKITDIRVERLHDISEEDAIAEGVKMVSNHNQWFNYLDKSFIPANMWVHGARESFRTLWESINGPDSWWSNPWVWCVSFAKTDKPE